MKTTVAALLLATAAAQIPGPMPSYAPTEAESMAPSYAPSEAESMAPSYAPTEQTFLYDPSPQPTVAPSTETASPSVTPVPTASKAQAVVGVLGVTGLTIAQCIANKPIFAQSIATIAGVPVSQVSVGCNVASTRRRLTSGLAPAVVDYAVNFPPDSAEQVMATYDLLNTTPPETFTEEMKKEAEASTIPEASVLLEPEFEVTDNEDVVVKEPVIETDIPIEEPTAAPMTLAPTSDDDTTRKLSEEQAPARKALYFIDYGAPGTGAAPTHGRRLSATAVGCQVAAWAPNECVMPLADVPHLCGSMHTCAGAICGGKDFVLDGKPACIARGEIDFTAAPRTDVYALSKEEAPAAAIVRGPASRKLLFAAAAYGAEVYKVLEDIWHR